MSTHKDLASKLDDLERKLGEHDQNFQAVFEPSGNSWHRQWHRPNRESASTRIDIPCPHSRVNCYYPLFR